MTEHELGILQRHVERIFRAEVEAMKENFVTMEQFRPVAEMVREHDRPYRWGKKYWNRLAWLGLASIWASPHLGTIAKWTGSLFKMLGW